MPGVQASAPGLPMVRYIGASLKAVTAECRKLVDEARARLDLEGDSTRREAFESHIDTWCDWGL